MSKGGREKGGDASRPRSFNPIHEELLSQAFPFLLLPGFPIPSSPMARPYDQNAHDLLNVAVAESQRLNTSEDQVLALTGIPAFAALAFDVLPPSTPYHLDSPLFQLLLHNTSIGPDQAVRQFPLLL